jgi:hypothetical protein
LMIRLAKVRRSAPRVSPAGRLGVVAIETECRGDASDHVRCQELHNERDEIDSHVASSSLLPNLRR